MRIWPFGTVRDGILRNVSRGRFGSDNEYYVNLIRLLRAAVSGTETALLRRWRKAIDCLGSVIAHAIAERLDVPQPARPKRGQGLVRVPLWIAPKLALYWRMRGLGLNNSQHVVVAVA